ncbi:MAG: S9 family peptidase [Candidatus Acidiferrum sp.]
MKTAGVRTGLLSAFFMTALLTGGWAWGAQQTGARHPIMFDDLARIHRVSDSQLSPDGKWVAYSLATPNLETNRNESNVWMVATAAGADKREALQLTSSGQDSSPAWSPDGRTIAFISSRGGKPQVYLLSMDGGEARQLTQLSTGVDIVKWSPNGKMLAFTSAVYPECKDDACNRRRDEEKEKNKVKARVYEQLLYRHWTHWFEGKHSHLFVIAADGDGAATDLTPGANYDVPPDERGEKSDIDFSPDGKEICFTAVTDKMEATSTPGDLCLVSVPNAGQTTPVDQPKRITTNPGFDGNPSYSPDGQSIAYHAQFGAGYESDRWRVMLYDRRSGRSENLSEGFDRSASGLAWSGDSKTIYFTAEDQTLSPIYAMEARAGATPRKIADGFNSQPSWSANRKTMAFERSSLTMPREVFTAASDGSNPRQLTHHNDSILATLEMNAPETFWFAGADRTKVQAMLIRPPNFDQKKKYPLLVLLHGGPQTMWTNEWGYRWNAQVFSAPGYVTLMINRRGSTGYGQKFTDEVAGDWGGRAYTDVMKGVDYTLEKYSFTDGQRMAAAGGSYGGFMANWIATHTGRFKAIISHAGVYDANSMYATEELWFQEHDMQGTPWSNPESYKKWSALTYAGELGKFKTPMLVIAGENDFRVPYQQSLELFNALQRQEVPSKLVLFPDEGHWILKPANSQFWYKTFLDWLATYLR